MRSRRGTRGPGVVVGGWRHGLGVLGIWMGMVCLGGGGGWLEAAEAMRVGLLLPPEEALRESLRWGAERAVERYNATGSPPVRLFIRGRSGQWGDDGEEVGRLVMGDGVRVLITPPGGVPTHLLLQVAGRTQVPVVTLNGDDGVIGAGIPWMVRLVPGVEEELGLLVGAGRWWVVVGTTRGAREMRRVVERMRGSGAWAGSDVWVEETGGGRAEAGTNGVLAAASRCVRERVDGVLLWLDAEAAGRWVVGLRGAGYGGRLGGTGWLRGDRWVTEAGEAARGFRVVTVPEAPKGEPESTGWDAAAAWAHDGVGVARSILLAAGEREARTVFPMGEVGAGLTGEWRFDAAGRRRATWVVRAWDGRAWVDPGGI